MLSLSNDSNQLRGRGKFVGELNTFKCSTTRKFADFKTRILVIIIAVVMWSIFLAINSNGFAQTLPTLNIYATGTTSQSATIKEGETISVDIKRSATATIALDVTIKIEETTTASSTNILENSLETTSETVTILANMTTYTHSLDSQQDTTSTSNGEVVITLLATTPATYTLPTPATNQKVTFTVNHTTLPKISISTTATEFVEGNTFPLKIEVTSGTVPSGGLTVFLNSIPSGIDNHVLLLGPRHSDSYSIPDDQTEKEFTVHTNARPGFFPRGFIEIVPHIAPQGTTTGYVFSSTNKLKLFVQDANVPTLNIKTNQATGIEGATIEMEIELDPAPLVNIPVTLSHNSSAYFDSFSPVSDPTNMPNVVSIPRNSTSFTVEIVTTSDNTETMDGTITVTISENRTYYKVDTTDDDFTISVMNFSSITNISIDKSSTLTSINEGENFEITLTVSAIQTIDLPVTLTISDNDLGYHERFDPNPIVIPANSETLTVTVYTERLPANDADTTFRISVAQDIANSNPNLRYVAAEGNSGYVELEITNIVNPTVEITSTVNESSVVESTAFTFTLMATPAPATNEVLPITLTLTPENSPYLDANLQLTYEIDSTGMLDVTVPTNLVDPGTTGDTIEIEIVKNTDLYLIKTDYEKIAFGITKVADADKSVISITSDSNKESIGEGKGFMFTLTAKQAPESDLEVNLTISDDSDFIEPDLTSPFTIPTSGMLDVDVMTMVNVVSVLGGQIEISIAEHSNYYISGKEDHISVTIQNIATLISIEASDGPHIEGSTISFTVSISPPPRSTVPVTVEVNEMSGDNILVSSPQTKEIQLSSSENSDTVSFQTVKNGIDMLGGSLTATISTRSVDAAAGQNRTATVALEDSDDPPVISISTQATSVTEGGTGAEINLIANNTVSNIELPIVLEIDDGDDHNFFQQNSPFTETVNLPARESSISHTITPQDDNVAELSGSFTIELQTATTDSNYSIASFPNNIINLQFIDDELTALPQVSVIPVMEEITEGEEDDDVNASFEISVDLTTTTNLMLRYQVSESGNYLKEKAVLLTGMTPVSFDFTNGISIFKLPIESDMVVEGKGIITFEILSEMTNFTYRINEDSRRAEVRVTDDDGGETLPQINISSMEEMVIEGEDIVFTLTRTLNSTTASPSELTIFLNIDQTGDFLPAEEEGARTVNIPISGTTSFTVSTSQGNSNLSNGTVIAEIQNEPITDSNLTYSLGTNFRKSVEVIIRKNVMISISSANTTPITAGQIAMFEITSTHALQSSALTVLIDINQGQDLIQWRIPNNVKIAKQQKSTTLKLATKNIMFGEESGPIMISISIVLSNDYGLGSDRMASVEVMSSTTDTSSQGRISVADTAVNAILNFITQDPEPPVQSPSVQRYQPLVSIHAIEHIVAEGQPIRIIIETQLTNSNDLVVNIVINGGQSFVNLTSPNQQVLIPREQSSLQYTLATFNDERAEEDETMIVSIAEGEGYSIADSPLNQVSVLISDANDRTEYNQRLSAANRILIPELMATTGIQSYQTMSNRVQLAFNNEEQFLFEVGGQSNFTQILQLSGQTLNNQNDLLELLRDDTVITIKLTSDNSILNNTTAWLESENQNIYNLTNTDTNSWNGEFYTGNFGIDTQLDSGLLLGIATSMTENKISYTATSDQAFEYTASYTGFNPYIALNSPTLNTQVWLSSNVSSGYIDVDSQHQRTHRLNSNYSTITFGGESRLLSFDDLPFNGSSEFNLTGQGWLGQQHIFGDGRFTSDFSTKGHHVQISLTGNHKIDVAEIGTFNPNGLIGIRDARKEADTVSGVEFGLGALYSNNFGLTLEGFGRGFKGSEQQDYATTFTSTLTYNPNHDNTGSQLTISPRWGQSTGQTQLSLWQSNLNRENELFDHYTNGLQINSEYSYGIDLLDGIGVLTPFSAINYSESDLMSFDIGNRIEIGTDSSLAIKGTREIRNNKITNNKVQLQGTVRW